MTASTGPIEAHVVSRDAPVREVMRVIDAVTPKLAIVTDEDGVLVRTVTDGDIRRGLLAGIELETAVMELPGRDPVVSKSDDRLEVARLMGEAEVGAVVLVDEAMRPTAIADNAWASGVVHMSPPHLGTAELEFVKAAFEDNWIAPAGPHLARFEQRLADISDRRHALALGSGTAAIHLALRVLGVGPGDRVYVSDLTFAASLQPVLYQGATPVLIDCEPVSWNMSPVALARRLARDARNGTLPRAVIVVHLYGQPADVGAIQRLTETYGVPLIEDAAESLGATYRNRPSGAHGVLAAYSFNGNKIVTTSGGGALVGDDGALIGHARKLSTQGREPVEHYQHSEIAYNYRLSNVLAGIGIGQLQLLGERVAARRAIYRRYREGLGDIAGIGFQEDVEGSSGNRWLSVIRLNPDHIDRHPFQVMRHLRELGIETRPGWKPMSMQPLCSGCEFEPHDEQAPQSPALFFQSLCLPSGSSLSSAHQDRIIDYLRKILREG